MGRWPNKVQESEPTVKLGAPRAKGGRRRFWRAHRRDDEPGAEGADRVLGRRLNERGFFMLHSGSNCYSDALRTCQKSGNVSLRFP